MFSLTLGESIGRLRVGTGALALSEVGLRIAQGTPDFSLSTDGKPIALVSGGGNYVPDDRQSPQQHGTYLYYPMDLARPVSVIESGSAPERIAFDGKHDVVFAQNS